MEKLSAINISKIFIFFLKQIGIFALFKAEMQKNLSNMSLHVNFLRGNCRIVF